MVPLKERDAEHNSFTTTHDLAEVSRRISALDSNTKIRGHRKSAFHRASNLLWLARAFCKFDPDKWWAASLLIIMRLLQTSGMVLITDFSVRAVCASLVAWIGIYCQRNIAPFRRPSDNKAALTLQWLIFAWCCTLVIRDALRFSPPAAVGISLIVMTSCGIGYVLRLILIDVQRAAASCVREAANATDLDNHYDDEAPATTAKTSVNNARDGDAAAREGPVHENNLPDRVTLAAEVIPPATTWESYSSSCWDETVLNTLVDDEACLHSDASPRSPHEAFNASGGDVAPPTGEGTPHSADGYRDEGTEGVATAEDDQFNGQNPMRAAVGETEIP